MSLYTCNSSINTLQKFNRICISTISLNGSDGSYALAIKFEVMLELRESCKPSWQPDCTPVIIVSVLKFLHCDGLNTFCRHRPKVREGFFFQANHLMLLLRWLHIATKLIALYYGCF